RSPAPSRWLPHGRTSRAKRSTHLDHDLEPSAEPRPRYRRNLRRRYVAMILAPRAKQAPRLTPVRWYPIHGYQHDRPSQLQAPSLPVARATTVNSAASDTSGRHVIIALDSGSHINVGGQPRAAPTRLVFFARGRARLVGCSALFGSPPLPRTALVVLRTPRSASLTASAEGKAAATSGSSRTRLLPLRSRATYLPRTPPFIDAKSYSGLRSSSAGLVVLLIECSFAPRRSSGADDADGIVTFSMRHDQETSPLEDTNGHKAHLVLGMSLVREGRRQRVFENSGCFIKTDAAASDVRRSLLGPIRTPPREYTAQWRSTLKLPNAKAMSGRRTRGRPRAARSCRTAGTAC